MRSATLWWCGLRQQLSLLSLLLLRLLLLLHRVLLLSLQSLLLAQLLRKAALRLAHGCCCFPRQMQRSRTLPPPQGRLLLQVLMTAPTNMTTATTQARLPPEYSLGAHGRCRSCCPRSRLHRGVLMELRRQWLHRFQLWLPRLLNLRLAGNRPLLCWQMRVRRPRSSFLPRPHRRRLHRLRLLQLPTEAVLMTAHRCCCRRMGSRASGARWLAHFTRLSKQVSMVRMLLSLLLLVLMAVALEWSVVLLCRMRLLAASAAAWCQRARAATAGRRGSHPTALATAAIMATPLRGWALVVGLTRCIELAAAWLAQGPSTVTATSGRSRGHASRARAMQRAAASRAASCTQARAASTAP